MGLPADARGPQDDAAPKAPPSLVVATKLGRVEEARWHLALYDEAGEAGASFTRPSRGGAPGPSGVVDEERSRREATRRARAHVRRYCAANRLNRLGTLTYAGEGCEDLSVVYGHAALFFRRLRDSLGGDPIPYLYVAEWHPGGHGLHVHFGVGGFIHWSVIKAAWGRGRVDMKLLGDLPALSTSLVQARRSGAYLGKYVAKEMDRSAEVRCIAPV